MKLMRKFIAGTAVTGALMFGGIMAANAATPTTAKSPATATTAATAKTPTPPTGSAAKAKCPNM